ncbi:MAG: dihydrofolate reductase [Chitinophagaceae bacterium]|nr:MAG: dihydrofolate reductase [Chitinophagaceae bacterium]
MGMRKLVVSMNITLDGYLSGPDCELDWHFNAWTQEMGAALCDELSKADTILLGRKTYDAMAAFWPSKETDPFCSGEDFAFAYMMNSYRKIIISGTLRSTSWSNSELAPGNIEDEIRALKTASGKNIIVYGSARLVDTLISAGLVDEYQLWIHPVVLGTGKQMFNQHPPVKLALNMELGDVRKFSSGVLLLNYRPLGSST